MDYSYDYADYYDYAGLGTDTGANTGALATLYTFLGTYIVVILIVAAIMIVAQWKIFTKAGKPGWASLIPIYNIYVLYEIVGMKGWYAFLSFIPFVGAAIVGIMSIIAYVKLATCFEKSTGYAVGLILLPVVFLPMLGFSKATYTAPIVEATQA